MFTILFFCLISMVLTQQPQPCTSPPQWEGRIFDSNEQQHMTLQARISYDATYHRVRLIEDIHIDDDDLVLDVLALYDAKIEFRYDLKHQNCSRRTINEPWESFEIPPDAQSLGEAYIGSSAVPNGGLLVTMWSGNVTLITNETIPYISTWTLQGCIPVSRVLLSPKYGNQILSFFDVTAGISDPNVFIPRRECLIETEYAMRNVLFGKPTKKV